MIPSLLKKDSTMSDDTRELTYGEKACGVDFNPGASSAVACIKQRFAECIDSIDSIRRASDSPEVKRMASVSITEAQTAQMWAVKAATWPH